MIVEFSVQNFRSIRELQTISFAATGLKSPEEYVNVDQNNIKIEGGMRLLKTIGIYGANGSGKSNIIRAIEYFLDAIMQEASSQSNLGRLCDPFLYQDNSFDTESFFQIVLILKDKKYRYGFTVKRNSGNESSEVISNEWFYGPKEKNSGAYFIRKGKSVDKDKLPNKERIPALPYEHTLFITHAAAFDSEGICATIRNFIRGNTISNFTEGLERFRRTSLFVLEQDNRKSDFLSLLSSFNLKYSDILLERDSTQPQSLVLPHDKIFLLKSFRDTQDKEKMVKLNLSFHESAGTQKLFDMAGLLLRGFNAPSGGLVILDEVDSNFHPSLLIKLIGLFNNPDINRSNLQLLFTSHDTNLMSPSIMRRDQFYFTEKEEDNSSRIYSLADLKGIRNDADFAKQYLAGVYGALPVLNDYINIITNNDGGTLEA